MGTQRRSTYFINCCGWKGEWGSGGVGVGASLVSNDCFFHAFIFFFKNRACDVDFCRSRRIGFDFYAVKVKKHRAIYSYLTEN